MSEPDQPKSIQQQIIDLELRLTNFQIDAVDAILQLRLAVGHFAALNATDALKSLDGFDEGLKALNKRIRSEFEEIKGRLK